MSTVLREIDQALASYAAQHHARPVVVYLGERKLTQLILEVAQLSEQPALSTSAGRPVAYRNLDILCDEVNVDGIRVI